MSFHEDKAKRTSHFWNNVYMWRLRVCNACNGTGRYDHNGSPKCSSCEGTGKVRYDARKEPYVRLLDLMRTMDLPFERLIHRDWKWLLRNVRIRNGNHPKIEKVMFLLRKVNAKEGV
jgi:hypothetical protein